MISNKLWQEMLQKDLQSTLASLGDDPGHFCQCTFEEEVDVAVEGIDGEGFPFVIAEEVEFLGEVLFNHHRLCNNNFLLPMFVEHVEKNKEEKRGLEE